MFQDGTDTCILTIIYTCYNAEYTFRITATRCARNWSEQDCCEQYHCWRYPCVCANTHNIVMVQCDQPVASASYMLHALHQPAGIVGLIIQETLCIINIHSYVSDDLTYMYKCVYTTAILNPTHCISVCYVQNSWSYNYIYNVIFTSPSMYICSIGFGHVSLVWWSIPPICVQVQLSTTRITYADM